MATCYSPPLECQICLQSMVGRRPRALPCLHTFCEQCLVPLAQQDGNCRCGPYRLPSEPIGRAHSRYPTVCWNCGSCIDLPLRITCPACRQQFNIPEGGVGAFPLNFLINQISEHQTSPKGHQRCQMCEQDSTHACETCFNFLCSTCKARHDSVPAFSSHIVHMLQHSVKCFEHGREAGYVCTECKERVCVQCIMMDKHQTHTWKIEDYGTWVMTQKEAVNKLENAINPKLGIFQVELIDAKQRMKNIQVTLAKLNATYNKMKEKLNQEHEAKYVYLEKEGNDLAKAIQNMEKVCSDCESFHAAKNEDKDGETAVKKIADLTRKGELVLQCLSQLPTVKKTWFSFTEEEIEKFGTLRMSNMKPQ